MGKLLLKNIQADGRTCDILIDGERISRIGKAGSETAAPETEVMDCTGRVAVPGFINMHTHAAMALMRGMEEDVAFPEWIGNIWDIETRINGEYIYWGTKVAAIEMIRTGTTTFNDQYWYLPEAHKAAVEMGVRPAMAYVILDKGRPEAAARQREQCQRRYEESLDWKDGAIFSIAFHSIYSVSEEMMLWAAGFAEKYGLNLHIHLSETRKEVEDCRKRHGGLAPVEYLDRLGILNERTIAAHTLWLSDNEVRILGERKVTCVHNINSNTKLASGYKFRYNELRDAGANVCLGTDGCASSNNLDMLEVMKTSALLQKAWRYDPKALPLEELLAAATRNGAKALRIDAGEIREGALADLLIVNTDNSFFLSPGSFLANFIYSAHSDCIESVIAGGRPVMRNRKIDGEREILSRAREMLDGLMKKEKTFIIHP